MSPHPSSVTAPRRRVADGTVLNRQKTGSESCQCPHSWGGRGVGDALGEESESVQKPPYFMVESGQDQGNADGWPRHSQKRDITPWECGLPS